MPYSTATNFVSLELENVTASLAIPQVIPVSVAFIPIPAVEDAVIKSPISIFPVSLLQSI